MDTIKSAKIHQQEAGAKRALYRSLRYSVTVATAFAALVWTIGLGNQAQAGEAIVTLCPSGGTVGGFGGNSSDTTGPLDGTCGPNSAVTISLPASIDYGKLQFDSSTPGYPAAALSGLLGLSANVSFTTGGSDQPYYLLAFTDTSDSLGQGASGDQILMIEFQAALSGNTLAASQSTTQFNLYDNTTGQYLQGGQHVTNSLAGWLTAFPSLGNETLQGVWIGEGLTGGDTGPESLTVNSVTLDYVPEPASLSLFAVALAGVGLIRRKRLH